MWLGSQSCFSLQGDGEGNLKRAAGLCYTCCTLPTFLQGVVLSWFNHLPPSTDSWSHALEEDYEGEQLKTRL